MKFRLFPVTDVHNLLQFYYLENKAEASKKSTQALSPFLFKSTSYSQTYILALFVWKFEKKQENIWAPFKIAHVAFYQNTQKEANLHVIWETLRKLQSLLIAANKRDGVCE